jgi:hypothetical protein
LGTEWLLRIQRLHTEKLSGVRGHKMELKREMLISWHLLLVGAYSELEYGQWQLITRRF